MGRSYSVTNKRTWTQNNLWSVLFELTYACNLDCSFCYNDLGLKGTPLTYDEYDDVLTQLASMGVMNITLTGGEPLAHKDFFRIGARARELGFVIRIKSNGHSLRGTMLRRLREEVDPYIVETSLHGSTAEVHDAQTRTPGSFVRLMENMRLWREAGMRTKINSTMTSLNEHQTAEIFAIAAELDAQIQIDPDVKPRDDGDTSPLTMSASKEAVARLAEIRLADIKRRAGLAEDNAPKPTVKQKADARREQMAGSDKHCAAGSAHLTIDPVGNLLPCVQWRQTVGNVREGALRTLWAAGGAFDEIRETNRKVKRLVDGLGDAGQMMSFCPGAAHTYHGSPLAMYAPAEDRLATAHATDRVANRVHLRLV